MTKITAFGFVIVTILFTVIGQVLIKWQAMHAGPLPSSWPDRATFFFRLVLNPWIITGLLSAVVAACAWILAMTRLPINVAYPIMSLTYPLIFFLGWLLFGETLSQWRIVGVLFILVGVAVIGINA
ncbi:MAG: hypothetical protein WBR15_11760 [Gammaproteobacteria bacterium]